MGRSVEDERGKHGNQHMVGGMAVERSKHDTLIFFFWFPTRAKTVRGGAFPPGPVIWGI